MPGAGALPAAEQRSVDYAAEARLRRTGIGGAVPAWRCPRTGCEGPSGSTDFGGDALIGPVTGTTVLPVDPITAFAEGRAARVPVLIGSNRDEFTMFVAPQYVRQGRDLLSRAVPAAAVGYLRRQRGCGRRALSAGSITTAVCRWPTRRRSPIRVSPALPTGWPTISPRPTRYTHTSSTTAAPLRRRCCGHLPFQMGAGHSLELRYLLDVARAQPLNPGPASAVRPDGRLLEPRSSPRARRASRASRTGADRQADVAAAGRQPRHHQLRRDTPVPVLGEP